MGHVTLLRLKRTLKRVGVTQTQVAHAAGVSRTMVVHTLAGRTTSRKVLDTARRLIAEARPDDGNAA